MGALLSQPLAHTPSTASERAGLAYGLAAYGLWGVLPIFWHQVQTIEGLELLAHRILWSCPIFIGWLVLRGRLAALRAVFGDRRMRRGLALSGLLLATNWFVFVYAVLTHRVLDASLGYFINPLVSVALGRVFLGETLRRTQAVAVALAAAGIAFAAWRAGGLPWISVALAGSFGTYGLLRKTTRAEPVAGSAFETLLLAPFALGYLVWLGARGSGSFLAGSLGIDGFLVATGLVTAAPLFAFVNAAPRLRLTTLGFVQFLAPTLQFAIAILVFDEPLHAARLLTFALVWAAVAVFIGDAFAKRETGRRG